MSARSATFERFFFAGHSGLLGRSAVREAKENKFFIFFVPGSSTKLSSRVAEGPPQGPSAPRGALVQHKALHLRAGRGIFQKVRRHKKCLDIE